MKLWKEALVRIISQRYKIPIVGIWHHSPVKIIEDERLKNSPPVLYDLSRQEIVRRRLCKQEDRSSTGQIIAAGTGIFAGGIIPSWLKRTQIRVGKNWLKNNLTEKQFASYTIEILKNGRKEVIHDSK